MSDKKEGLPSEEKHSYDGIDELDNALPRWWINGFYLTIIFAVGYLFHYSLGDGQNILQEFEHSKADYEAVRARQKKDEKVISEEEWKTLSKETTRVPLGRAVFEAKCVSCHGQRGEGGIGPNLTDDYWLHGARRTDVFQSISRGVPEKGMPPWGPLLKPEEVQNLVLYVKSLRGTKPTGAKAPQGEQGVE